MIDELAIFLELHQGLPRESPGGPAYTRQAFELLPPLPQPHILDIGCGPGEQTLTLARLSDGSITAVDTHQPYLNRLAAQAQAEFPGRITCLNADMAALPFDPHRFDLIWSEGAIYIMGLEAGLGQWRDLLRPGGYLAISELVWLRPNPPAAIASFWQSAYPAMSMVDRVAALIPTCGYSLVGQFVLPPPAWWNYYRPLEDRLKRLHAKYHDQPQALTVLAQEQQEIELYRAYGDWYGYSFFVMQQVGGGQFESLAGGF